MYKIIFEFVQRIGKLQYLSLLIILLTLLFNLTYLLFIPPIWPDEALHADLADNILKQNRYGTDLLTGTLPGVERYGFGYPPLFFNVAAIWIKFFGFSIYTFRLLPLFLGIIFLILFFQVSKLFFSTNHKFYVRLSIITTSILLLTSDIAFIKSIHIARPEIQVLLLGFLSLYCYLKALIADKTQANKKILFYFLCGLTLSLAFLTHFLAIIFILSLFLHILISDFKKFYRRKEIYAFFIAFFVPILIWFISMYPGFHYFLNNVTLRLRYKTNAPNWIWIILLNSPASTKIGYLLYITILILSFYVGFIFRNIKGFLILFLLIFSWVFAYLWQTEYSFIYVVVFSYIQFGYLAYTDLITKNSIFKVGSKIYLSMALLFLIFNFSNDINIFKQFSGDNYSYKRYTESLLKIIPDNTSVYLSAIPDPYFGFKNVRNNILYEFPVLPTTKDNVISVLDKSDYIIINSPLEAIVAGNIVLPYIQNNIETIQTVRDINQYQVTVVKLKPRSSRTSSL